MSNGSQEATLNCIKYHNTCFVSEILKNDYKCLGCDGKGKLWPQDTIDYNRCEPCEGKGIAWG